MQRIQATASDLPLIYHTFVPQKVPLTKISHDVIACDLWFGPPQSKILATPMLQSHRSIIAVRNFQRFYDRSFVREYEPIFILKLEVPNHKETAAAIIFFFIISSTMTLRFLEVSEQIEMKITLKILTK